MTAAQIIFFIVGIATLGAAIMVVSVPNLVHAALWLVVALFGIAVFYVMLNAGFLAVAQVVIYIGAIAILMIFAIMLTRRVAEPESGSRFNANWPMGLVVSLVTMGTLVWILGSWSEFAAPLPDLDQAIDPVVELGQALVSPSAYIIPFEVASILLLAALIGAIIVAWDRK
jgi:NADH-quinone oxidoreductase subunit J